MKKMMLILFVAIAAMACEGPMGPEGPLGPTGQKGEPGYGNSWYTTSFTINSDEWELIGTPGGLNSYFFVDKSLTELTNTIYKEGTVVAYMETSKGVKNGLPYVLHKGDEDELGEFLWTQTYDFDFYPGGVGFYVTYSDFSTKIRPDTETFHIVLMW
ncbi:hypothetical protein GGR21_001722 [Dysgonomonas hofstadii]|uniref:Collagen-like protein n=1 Tax=Dysgonomonas hofstadii TaxID=637886 RepID=A0A840CIG5_9BACT|nr:collagen-like protein [Dysgonomonas hofstadii]MBB4035827.1 hypothetical protein [Dysgonomonas hofstadii]